MLRFRKYENHFRCGRQAYFYEDSSYHQGYMKKLLFSNRVAGLYLLMLLVAALIPLGMASETLVNNYTFDIRADYLLHAFVYIPLPLLLLLSRSGRKGGWLAVIIVSLVVVILFETVQILIPYRAFNINDLFANGVGVLIGLVPAMLVWRRFSGSVRSAHSSKG